MPGRVVCGIFRLLGPQSWHCMVPIHLLFPRALEGALPPSHRPGKLRLERRRNSRFRYRLTKLSSKGLIPDLPYSDCALPKGPGAPTPDWSSAPIPRHS